MAYYLAELAKVSGPMSLSIVIYYLSHIYLICQLMKFGSYHLGEQRRLLPGRTSVQSPGSLHCSHQQSMEVDEGPNHELDI